MNKLVSTARLLTWISFIIAYMSCILAIWTPDTVFWLKVFLTGLVGIVFFYAVEQKLY